MPIYQRSADSSALAGAVRAMGKTADNAISFSDNNLDLSLDNENGLSGFYRRNQRPTAVDGEFHYFVFESRGSAFAAKIAGETFVFYGIVDKCAYCLRCLGALCCRE